MPKKRGKRNKKIKSSGEKKRKEERFPLRIVVLILVILLGGVLAFSFRAESCQNFECFQKNMVQCRAATFINEEPEASWHYEIIGRKSGECEIRVTLLLAKEGELGIDDLEGLSMACSYPLGASAYPDKDLSVCHGILKEELQRNIIEKLHGYVLSNLKEIVEGLGGS